MAAERSVGTTMVVTVLAFPPCFSWPHLWFMSVSLGAPGIAALALQASYYVCADWNRSTPGSGASALWLLSKHVPVSFRVPHVVFVP